MWSRICISGETFAFNLRIFKEENKFLVLMFDKKNLWSEEMTNDVFTKRCKNYNPTLEFSESSTPCLINKTLALLADESNNVKRVVNRDDIDHRIVNLETRFGGVPFKFQLHLKLIENSTTIHDEVTRPLFCYVHDLEMKQRFLIDAIKKKDIEINEYKMQGAHLSRRNAETGVFKEEQFFQDGEKTFPEEVDSLLSFINATMVSKAIASEKCLRDKTSNDMSISGAAEDLDDAAQEHETIGDPGIPVTSQAVATPGASQELMQETSLQGIKSLEKSTKRKKKKKLLNQLYGGKKKLLNL